MCLERNSRTVLQHIKEVRVGRYDVGKRALAEDEGNRDEYSRC